MKLSEWAKKQGISYLTAYRWFRDGKLPVEAYQSESGTIIIKDDSDTSEQPMLNNQSNDSMSLFLKKTVEYSKNNSSVEDFAAYVLSNFSLKINNAPDSSSPKYSKNKPKAEDIQKHFKQFLKPKNENLKPIPREFVTDSDILEKLGFKKEGETSSVVLGNIAINNATLEDVQSLLADTQSLGVQSLSEDMQSLVNDLSLALAPIPTTNIVDYNTLGAYEGVVSRNNELSLQSTNYTGSNNSTLMPPSFSSMVINSAVPQPAVANIAFQPPSLETIANTHEAANKLVSDIRATVTKTKRGRKPYKNLGNK